MVITPCEYVPSKACIRISQPIVESQQKFSDSPKVNSTSTSLLMRVSNNLLIVLLGRLFWIGWADEGLGGIEAV